MVGLGKISAAICVHVTMAAQDNSVTRVSLGSGRGGSTWVGCTSNDARVYLVAFGWLLKMYVYPDSSYQMSGKRGLAGALGSQLNQVFCCGG